MAQFQNIPPLPPPRQPRRSSISSIVSSPSPPPKPREVENKYIDWGFKLNAPSFIAGALVVMVLQAGGIKVKCMGFLAIVLLAWRPQKTQPHALPPTPQPSPTPHNLPRTPSPRRPRVHHEGNDGEKSDSVDKEYAFRPYGDRRSVIYSGDDIGHLD